MNASIPPTHPVEPDPQAPRSDEGAPNPTQLPVEPEFGPLVPAGEPEDPGVEKPHL